MVIFDNKMWLLGGQVSGDLKNDVWYSSDGKNWTCATQSAQWSARMGHTAVVFNNRMWVFGGMAASRSVKNDVWYSPDGEDWTQATASAGWSAREDHTSVVFEDKMWVMGGGTFSSYLNDIWYSTDGANWTKATSSVQWPARGSYAAAVLNNRMWVIGGSPGMAEDYNDAWYYEGATGVMEDVSISSVAFSDFTVSLNRSTGVHIAFTLSSFASIKLSVYNGAGKEINVLCGERQSAGIHSFTWNGSNYSGANIPAGIYFIRLDVDDYRQVKKVVFVR